MRVSVTFRHMEPTAAIREYAEAKLMKVKRYLDEPIEANVVLSIEKYRHIAEVTLNAGRNVINCTEETNDIYSAIDMVLEKLERQVKKQKEKTRSKKGRQNYGREQFEATADMIDAAAESEPEWVKRITLMESNHAKPIDLEEAVLWLDDHPSSEFLLFTNASSARLNVMYRRRNGDYGLIETQAQLKGSMS